MPTSPGRCAGGDRFEPDPAEPDLLDRSLLGREPSAGDKDRAHA
ncbi:hypothetical protein [Dactylosporangium sp. CA-233914]